MRKQRKGVWLVILMKNKAPENNVPRNGVPENYVRPLHCRTLCDANFHESTGDIYNPPCPCRNRHHLLRCLQPPGLPCRAEAPCRGGAVSSRSFALAACRGALGRHADFTESVRGFKESTVSPLLDLKHVSHNGFCWNPRGEEGQYHQRHQGL